MLIWPALALTLAQTASIEVTSADGHCVARIEHEHLTVFAVEAPDKRRELWGAPFHSSISAAKYALANSGRVVAQIAEQFDESHTTLHIEARGRDALDWNGSELKHSVSCQALGNENFDRTWLEGAWLDAARPPSIAWTDSCYGPYLELHIQFRVGLFCSIDLEHMSLVENVVSPRLAKVEPGIQGELPERCAVPYVQSVEVESVARTGIALAVSIDAAHPTPGWKLLGFQLEAPAGDMFSLMLTPRSVAPEGVSAQVLTPFRTTARLIFLGPGRYTLDVAGWSAEHKPLTIDVVPQSLLVRLHTRGGFAGIDQRVEILSQSVARFDAGRGLAARFIELSDARMEQLRAGLAALPAANRRAQTSGAADLFEHTLNFWGGEHWITIEVDDLAVTGPERDLIQALRSLL